MCVEQFLPSLSALWGLKIFEYFLFLKIQSQVEIAYSNDN